MNKSVLFYGLYLLTVVPSFAVTTLGLATYPTRTSGGSPANISNGIGVTNHNIVTGIVIDDDSTLGWTLTVTSTNGSSTQPRLLHTVNSATIDYDIRISNITGTLGTGLTVAPAASTTLIFSGASSNIAATGTATTSTVSYTFDLQMSIANGSTTGKLAGNYIDTLSLVLASND